MRVVISEPVGYRYPAQVTKARLLERYSGIRNDYRLGQRTQELFPVLDDTPGDHFHANYLEYLETAWGSHYGVVMTPDIMWYTLMSELVQIVAEEPKKYAFLFTTTPDKKQTIIIRTPELVVMPLDVLIDSLKSVVPSDVNAFMPGFTTTTDRSRMAMYASFADLVSPYYNYMMLACGIPYVDVLGTDEDWHKVAASWRDVTVLLPGHDAYFAKVQQIVDRIALARADVGLWREMFRLERCGSGSQVEVFGWFSELYRKPPEYTRYVSNFASHLARVCYKQIDTDKDYEMYHGVLSSQLQDDCLVPEFGSMIFHRPKEPKVESLESYTMQTVR